MGKNRAMPCIDVEGGPVTGHMVMCPACKHGHKFNTPEHPTRGGAKWSFNGNLERPTFTPSMLVTCDMRNPPVKTICHSYVTDGRIQFLGDCTHEMKGQTVDLPEFE